MTFKAISPEQHDAFLATLRAGQYNLLLGAGASMDSRNAHGPLPSGDGLRDELASVKSVSKKYTLQRVFSLLNPSEVQSHITTRLMGCAPGYTSLAIKKFLWRRIFTWNIDDSLENSYSDGISKQALVPLHFNDDYVEATNIYEILLVYLHGTVLQDSKGYVFSRDQYVKQITKINPWMTVLSQFMQSEPMIISGTSLDEIDLDYYLAQRSSITSRDDRGPSIIVTSEDDGVSQDLCKTHNLLHFVGRSADFLRYCEELLPNPPTPDDLIPVEMRRFLPEDLVGPRAASFMSDFELVPGSAKKSSNSRFLYGHIAQWGDLESNLDIPRTATAELISDIDKRLNDAATERLIILPEAAGLGKTTILRRAAFELAKRGTRTLLCSSLGRIDSSTASILDKIHDPIVIFIDDFADQVTAVAEVIANLNKADVLWVTSERGYRLNYLKQVLSGIPFAQKDIHPLSEVDATRLVDRYAESGLVGSQSALKNRTSFISSIVGDPIAIASCRIMNDFRPLQRIVDDCFETASIYDVDRYLLIALTDHCFKGGLRYEILLSAANPDGIRAQFDRQSPLPLAYFDPNRQFVVPQNATLADRLLSKIGRENPKALLEAFVSLARQLRPRVNRLAIKRRTPEARLAGRLFDYDNVADKLLGARAAKFYEETKDEWKWNSRYWEQVALMRLAEFKSSSPSKRNYSALEDSIQHARFAVSIEYHPFCLTTLGKILMAKLEANSPQQSIYDEAFDTLTEAISIERARARNSVQPYAILYSGTRSWLESGGALNAKQRTQLAALIPGSIKRYSKDPAFDRTVSELQRLLSI